MDLHELIHGLPVDAVRVPAGCRVGDLTEDSRTVQPGTLFVARPGRLSDGRGYIDRVIADGASAVLTDAETALRIPSSAAAVLAADDVPLATALLAERFFGSPSSQLRTAGITGTNGKTTVAHLAHGLLNASGIRCGLVGTVSIDDGREVADAGMTTLPAIELSRTLATMVEHGCRCAVMEVSSHALDQQRTAAIGFDAAVFTTLGSDHLDYHGTIDRYAAAKARLFEGLGPESLAIVNADDPACERMLRGCESRVLRCGDRQAARADVGEQRVGGIAARYSGPFGVIEASLPLAGDHNAANMLQAMCIAHAFGATAEQIAAASRHPTPPPGRLERVSTLQDDLTVFVDFAHTPDALEHTLGSLGRAIGDRSDRPQLWVVFGCGGDRDTAKRPVMGETAARLADRVVVTSDNPRSEDPDDIIEQVIAGMPALARQEAVAQAERETAIDSAISLASPGDIIVIAGKGHERTQISADGSGGLRSRPFDDREHAKRSLAARASTTSGAGAAAPSGARV
ncbi:MAG: UDP-N-acetylmuramoyl-L-alanyl-D-glutamate--2,6-diaminopimelate ligase [Planctomycetota bacterium]